jgi:ABC-2 type transport system ATP-binding protein
MLDLKNVSKSYGTFQAVKDLTLSIEDGELFGLLGPNGAGKSTTVSMLSTVVTPSSGEIFIHNQSLRRNPRAAKAIMGIVPQDLALYQSLSAKDNLSFFGSLYGLKGKELRHRVDEVLEIIELRDKQNQDVAEFSGGMKRRVNIGVALMNHPKLLVLDEPTVGIDPQSRNHILETVRRLNSDRGMTVIYTSHYMEEVEHLCTRIAIIDHGQLIASGTKDELKQATEACDTLTVTYSSAPAHADEQVKQLPGVARVSINGSQMKLLINPRAGSNALKLIEALKNIGFQLTGFNYVEANLESIFLKLTGKTLRD